MDLDNGFVRKILFAAMLCALFVPFQAGDKVRAQSQTAVTVTARAGFRGFCKSDKWLPIHVTVENQGADVDARVQAAYKNSASGQTTVGTDISLPATSRKEFFLYITPEGLMRNFTLSVLDGDKTLAKTNLNISCGDRTGDTSMLFGVLADIPANYILLNNVQPMTGEAQTAQIEIDDLPDLAQGWGMLDALVISNVDTGRLTPEQKQALELWLAGGGKLFVTGGIQWQSTAAGLGNLLPLQPTSTRRVSALSALSIYAMEADNPLESEAVLATGKLQTGANVLVEQDGIPLLVEKEIGFGKVYYFAADPGLNPLNDWDGMEKIYEHLLAFKSPKPSWAYGTWDTYQANTALSTLPELSLPSFVYICCWLGLYIVIIAPVNYFILRRRKRMELAWITVPILVVIFTCMAYFSGYAYRGTKPILNRIMLAQGWQGVEKAQTTALVGVYSPTRTTYNVESQEQFLLFPFPSINEDLQGNNGWLSLSNDSGVVVPDVRVEIGGMQSLGMDGYLPALPVQHDLKYILSDKTPVLKGSIINISGHTLKDAVIITSSGWDILGDIAPSESRKVSLILSNTNSINTSRYALISDLGWDMLSNEKVEDRRHSALFNSITTSYNDTLSANSGVYLMAWLDDEISVPVSLQGEEPSVTDTLFHIQRLTPAADVNSGKLMLTSSVYGWESSLGETLTASSYNLSSSGYNVSFRPSLPFHFREVDSLSVTIGTNNTPQMVSASIWNFQTETWQLLDLGAFDSASVPEAWQYVGMDGEILLNIQGDTNNYFDITSVDFTMMVQP